MKMALELNGDVGIFIVTLASVTKLKKIQKHSTSILQTEGSKDFRDTLFLFPVGWVKEAVRNTGGGLLDWLSLLHPCFGLQEFPGTCQL